MPTKTTVIGVQSPSPQGRDAVVDADRDQVGPGHGEAVWTTTISAQKTSSLR